MNSVLLFLCLVTTLMIRPASMMLMHFKCRGGVYPRSSVKRFSVPDDKINWSIEYQEYKPGNHTAKSIYGKLWADPEIAIKRGDTGEWALPGGMVDPGEKVTTTAVREFQEEAINCLVMSKDDQAAWEAKFNSFFSNGDEVYKGYIDDPRNTDNAWMESVAYNFHI